MSSNIAIFYHGLVCLGEPARVLPHAVWIITEQMDQMERYGLLAAASEIHVGINGGTESMTLAKAKLPAKANVVFHGLASRAENLTIVMIEEWVKTHPGWNVLYLHAKGATKGIASEEGRLSAGWRNGMMHDLVVNWRRCVADLDSGYDVVCSTFMWGMVGGVQNIAAGNFWWAKSDFLALLPSIAQTARVKESGIAALESRYEAEVWIGNGPAPKVRSYRPQPWWWRQPC